jgi:hypothetical protein
VASEEPIEVVDLRNTLMRLPGIADVSIQPKRLDGLDTEVLSFSEMADLPSGALRRTRGGLPGESLVQVWFTVDKTPESWTSLEFLGWFVRDACRAGDVAQIRVRGLAPRVGDQVQVGTTLEFVIEWFVIDADATLKPLLERVRQETANLQLFMKLYSGLLGVTESDLE